MFARTPVVLTLLLASATLSPAQQESFEAAQRFLDQTSDAYGVRKVALVLGEPDMDATATIQRGSGLITIKADVLDHAEFRDVVLSHEMAHLILGHTDRRPNSLVERQQREIDADVKAIEIVQRLRGMSESRAFFLLVAFLLFRKEGVDAGKRDWGDRHPHPCRTVDALLKAYPSQQATLDWLETNSGFAKCP